MKTVTYAVYELDTGEVVHLHVEPADLGSSPEEIVQIADPRRARRLGVIVVPREIEPGPGLLVVDQELRSAGGEVSSGAGGGTSLLSEPDVERRYTVT